MAALAQEVSTLTERYQTTVPSVVRKQLALKKGDRIRYSIEEDGRVYLEADRAENADPAFGPFLDLLEEDIKAHPKRLQAFDGGLRDRLAALIGDLDIDLDAALSPEDE
jgi:antitoxin PrlF